MGLAAGIPAASPVRARSLEGSLQDVLDRRAEAIVDRDRSAFEATLDDPDSPFGRRQLALFENLGSVPLAGYGLELDIGAFGDLARPRDLRRYPRADRVMIPYTLEKYRLKGYDKDAVHGDMYFTFVQRDGEWRIGGDDDLDDMGFFTQRNLWDFDPVVTEESERFLALAPECCSPDLTPLLGSAERAFQAVDPFWSEPWPRKVPLLVPKDGDDLARILQATYPVENYIAFSFWTGGDGSGDGARIIVNPERFSGDGSSRADEILTHELFHIATLPSSGGFIPNWLDEGFAQYVQNGGGGGATAAADAAVAATGQAYIPENYRFFIGDETDVFRNYQRGLSLVAFIAERWGEKALQRFYVELGRASSPGLRTYHLGGAAERALGVGASELRRAWASNIGL